jgi:F0F1-type ATP synthase membrane subunit b/b'
MLDQRAAEIVTARDEQRTRAERAEQSAEETRTEISRLRTEIGELRAAARPATQQRDGK